MELAGKGSLLDATLERFKGHEIVLISDRDLSPLRTVLEKGSRGTAAAVHFCLHTLLEEGADQNEWVLISPADQIYEDESLLLAQIKESFHSLSQDKITLFGAHPKEPSSHYGYILETEEGIQFVEKPERVRAATLITAGALWNTGLIVATIATLCREFDLHYHPREGLSIDRALLEKSDALALVPLKTIFVDLGTFESLYRQGEKDERENVLKGDVEVDGCKRCYFHARRTPIVAKGVSDLIVVETEEGILIKRLITDEKPEKSKSGNEEKGSVRKGDE